MDSASNRPEVRGIFSEAHILNFRGKGPPGLRSDAPKQDLHIGTEHQPFRQASTVNLAQGSWCSGLFYTCIQVGLN